MQERSKSKWYWWAFVPYLNFAAWLHAAVQSGRSSYCWLAVLYSIPMNFAVLLGGFENMQIIPKQTSEELPKVIGFIAFVFWIAGIFHVIMSKREIDKEIEEYTYPILQNGTGQSSEAIQTPVPSGVPVMSKSTVRASQKAFRYISADGSLIGPISAVALRTLQQTGAVTAETKVAEVNSARFIPLVDVLSDSPSGFPPRV
jgi:hypothetical protein